MYVITGVDIAKFLMSRYGIKVSPEDVAETISKGFGGGGISEADGDTMDLTEMMAMLLVPTLLKAEKSLHDAGGAKLNYERTLSADDFADDNKVSNGPQDSVPSSANGEKLLAEGNNGSGMAHMEENMTGSHLFKFVLNMILKDVTGDSEPKPITKELLRDIFLFYDEADVAEDDNLLEEMVLVACSGIGGNGDRVEGCENGGVLLDEHAFAYCLTNDIRLYDIDSEKKLSTTYFDVFQTFKSTKHVDGVMDKAISSVHDRLSSSESGEDAAKNAEKDESVRLVEKRYVLPSLDYAVDSVSVSAVLKLVFTLHSLDNYPSYPNAFLFISSQ